MEITNDIWKWAKIAAIAGIITLVMRVIAEGLFVFVFPLNIGQDYNELGQLVDNLFKVNNFIFNLIFIINLVFLSLYIIYREMQYTSYLGFILAFTHLSNIIFLLIGIDAPLLAISLIYGICFIALGCLLLKLETNPKTMRTLLCTSLFAIGLVRLLGNFIPHWISMEYDTMVYCTTFILYRLFGNASLATFFVALYFIFKFLQKEKEEDIYRIY